MKKHLYINQYHDLSLDNADIIISVHLARTKHKDVGIHILEWFGDIVMFTIKAFGGHVKIYPINEEFAHFILPMYSYKEISREERGILYNIAGNSSCENRASFFVDIDCGLSERHSTYLLKVIGMVLGGYYSKLRDVPSDGILCAKEHLYIEPMQRPNEDILYNMEDILMSYVGNLK